MASGFLYKEHTAVEILRRRLEGKKKAESCKKHAFRFVSNQVLEPVENSFLLSRELEMKEKFTGK